MRCLVFILILCSGPPLARDVFSVTAGNRFAVWNVGQGLWTTFIGAHECDHFDAGGEHWPLKEIRLACAGKINRVSLSHADLDHIGGLRSLRGIAPDLCLAAAPLDTDVSAHKRALYENLPPCTSATGAREIHWTETRKTANEFSRVFTFHGFLLPGDSPSTQEDFWASRVPAGLRILVLGHHGSRGSTSENLLKYLPHLKLAIASARERKYGHPHREVIQRLEDRNVALLRTEDWGHLVFEMP